MQTALVRSSGFSLTTVTFVLVLHLVKEQSVGEAIDGVVSGLWFTGTLRAHAIFGFALDSATMFAVGLGSGILAMRRSVPA